MKNQYPLRTLMILAWGVLLCGTAYQAAAQVIDNQASTAAQGAAEGLSSVISSAGQYNLMTSQAALTMTEVQRNEMQNQLQHTETFYQNRAIGRENREKERGPRPTPEQLVRYAQMGKPKPLTTAQINFSDGHITWPALLTTDTFSENRTKLDGLFAKRAENGGIGFEEQMEIRSATNAMIEALKAQIASVPADMYMAAKTFLQSLAYAATKAA